MTPTTLFLLVATTLMADPIVAFKRAEELSAADRFGEAEQFYKEALETAGPYLKRQTYDGLMRLYVRSGREDKAIRLAVPYGDWLRSIGDTYGLAELDLTVGECRLGLGYGALADSHLVSALKTKPALEPGKRLEALRLRAEAAALLHDPAESQRWADLEAAAAVIVRDAATVSDLRLRVSASRYLSESKLRRGDEAGALAILDSLPDLHDRLADAPGRRETQRQRAKLLVARGAYTSATPLFAEALAIHRKTQLNRRMVTGDILAEWAAAASANGQVTEAARLRSEASVEYRAVLDNPSTNPDTGGPLVAFVRLQQLNRSARQFRVALDITRSVGERWSGDPLLDARLAADQGGLELMASAYENARTLLGRALADIDATDPPNLRALPQVLVNLATAELACATPEHAGPLLDRCIGLYRTHRLPPDPIRVECEYLRGVATARQGDFSGAIGYFRGGLKIADIVGPKAGPVRFNLWLNIALIHKEQGDPAAASDALQEAAALLARSSEPDDLSAALINTVRADLLVTQGRVSAALELVPAIEAACAKHGLRTGYLWATSRHIRGLALLMAQDLVRAEAIWAELALAHRREKNVLLPRTLNFLGVCAELQGRDAAAGALFEEARAFQAEHPGGPPVTRAITLWRLAALADKAGRKQEAKGLLGEVFELADRARMNTFGEAAQRAQFFAQFTPAFELAAKWAARDGDGEGLLRVVARSRSRTLLDQTLAAGVDPRDRLSGDGRAGLLTRESAARTTISRLRGQVMLLPVDGLNDPAAKALIARLEAAQKDYADAWREIADADPLTHVLTDSGFAETSLARVRKDVHAMGGALLVYMFGRDESFALLCIDPATPPEVFRLTVAKLAAEGLGNALTGEATAQAGFRGITIKSTQNQPPRPPVDPLTVPLTDVIAGRLVDHYLPQISDPAFNPTRGISVVSRTAPTGQRAVVPEVLGDAVLPAALRDRIRATGAKRLVVIPDGGLHKLPLEALLVSGGPAPRYVIDDLPAISYAPSPALLAVVLARPRSTSGSPSLLTVGDPAYTDATRVASPANPAGTIGRGVLPRLPFTAVESRRIRAFFPTDRVTALEAEAATKPNVVAAIPGKRVVHLAAHGFADQAFGNLFAAVALTPPPPGQETPDNDGFLTLHEIHRLRLTDCELTVLSACVTNVGPQRPLEAGVTLAGAFLSAGSRGVMASYWSVDDKATAELMATHFKTVRLGDAKPGSHADALKAARLAVRSTPGWEAPFYWASFAYLGAPE